MNWATPHHIHSCGIDGSGAERVYSEEKRAGTQGNGVGGIVSRGAGFNEYRYLRPKNDVPVQNPWTVFLELCIRGEREKNEVRVDQSLVHLAVLSGTIFRRLRPQHGFHAR